MKKIAALLVLLLSTNAAFAADFTISSHDMNAQHPLAMNQVFNGFGCTGKNLSPQLSWQHAPANTKSFAITLYDPDAPTGSGWWHWTVINIPATIHQLPTGAGSKHSNLPVGSMQGRNDFGDFAFGGACPPAGDKPHRYILTVWALDTDTLPVTRNMSAAMIGFMLNAHKLATASLTATYSR